MTKCSAPIIFVAFVGNVGKGAAHRDIKKTGFEIIKWRWDWNFIPDPTSFIPPAD
jgi:hypothetical protein